MNGSKNEIALAVSLACASIIVSVMINTGLGISFASVILSLSGGNVLFALILVMILVLILGCGLPTTPAYIVASTIAISVLTRGGFTEIASHIFLLYFSVIAAITPPVAITAYGAAALAGSNNPILTGFLATKLAALGFIIPFAFITNNHLIAIGSIPEIVGSVIIVSIGILILEIGIVGYFKQKIGTISRLLAIIFGLIMIFYRSVFSIFF